MSILRSLVSKEKRRYVDHGYDLDLTYITSKLIAMGFPSKAAEGVYRNPHDEVVKFFEQFHKDHYLVYNLCSERDYDATPFKGRVERFPFDDHNAPPLSMIPQFLASADKWFAQHPDNVIAVHCKAGKGRTGVFICMYLLHCGICATADEAMDFYAVARTKNSKGLTIPSQRRYVRYYEEIMRSGYPTPPPLRLVKIRMSPVPSVSVSGFCPYFTIKSDALQYTSKRKGEGAKLAKFSKSDPVAEIDLRDQMVIVKDDIKMEFVNRGLKKTKMFHFWFNTGFVRDNTLRFTKTELDGSARSDKKDKIFPAEFTVELLFEPVPVEMSSVAVSSATGSDAAATAPAAAAPAAAAAAAGSVAVVEDQGAGVTSA